MKEEKNFKNSMFKAAKSLVNTLPIIFGTILLFSLIITIIPKSFYLSIFKNSIFDPILGSLVGSISAGNPITSYILGGEFLEQGVGLMAVTAFLVAWVSVGVIQLPAHAARIAKVDCANIVVGAIFMNDALEKPPEYAESIAILTVREP